MKSLGYKSKNYKSTPAIYHGISLVGPVWGEHLKKITKLFYLVLLFELILCGPCFAMFQDFFTADEIDKTARSRIAPDAQNFDQVLAAETRRIQARLASPDRTVSQLAAERIIRVHMDVPVNEHVRNSEESEEIAIAKMLKILTNKEIGLLLVEDPQNLRIRRIFEMLNHYDRHSVSTNLRLLQDSQVFLMAARLTSEGYTLQNLYFSMNWHMRLLTTTNTDEEFLHNFHASRALCVLDNLVSGHIKAEFFSDPYFSELLYTSIDFLGKHAQGFFEPNVRDENKGEGFLVKRIITTLMASDVILNFNNEVEHALLIERLIPLFRINNYIDYLLINHFRLVIAKDKLKENEEEGLRYIMSVLDEQGVNFPITSQGVTEDRPPIDPAFSALAYQIYRGKYLAELRKFESQDRTERDYRTFRALKDKMELCNMYQIQAVEEVQPVVKIFMREQEDISQNLRRREMYRDALSTVRARVKHGTPERKTFNGRRRNVTVQVLPKSTVTGYNSAGEYLHLKTDKVLSGGAAASAAASSSIAMSSAAASTTRLVVERTLMLEPLILLGSNHHRVFERIMNLEMNVTRRDFENLLVQLQSYTNSRSSGTRHTFYSVTPILNSPKISRSFREVFGLSINGNANDSEINRLLEELGLEVHRQGITLSIGEDQIIPEYQLRQIREHLRDAGYTLETVGQDRR